MVSKQKGLKTVRKKKISCIGVFVDSGKSMDFDICFVSNSVFTVDKATH